MIKLALAFVMIVSAQAQPEPAEAPSQQALKAAQEAKAAAPSSTEAVPAPISDSGQSSSSSTDTAGVTTEPMSIEESLQLRDPFRRPVRFADPTTLDASVPDLERYSVDQFRIVGIITGPKKPRALIAAPNNKMFIVQENDKLGIHKGVIRKIREKGLLIREKVVNLLGQEEASDTELAYQGQRDSGTLLQRGSGSAQSQNPQYENDGSPGAQQNATAPHGAMIPAGETPPGSM